MPKSGKKNKSRKQNKREPEPEPSPEPEVEAVDEDMDMDMDMDDMPDDMMMADESGPLFWSMKVEPGKTTDIDQPAIADYIVHITNACFGADVKKDSRSVVMVTTTNEDDDEEAEGVPICVLREGHSENQSLDLLFNESASLTVKGNKASAVFLTGYIQPPVNLDGAEGMGGDPMMEDLDEEQIMEALKEQKRQQEALDDDGSEAGSAESEEEEDAVEEPPTKKQRTAKGQKATAAGAKGAEKKRKNARGSDEEEVKPQKKGKKKLIKFKGLQYKDMAEGAGKAAKKGDKVRVYYVGQLESKEVFDKAITGSGFEFTLGKGEVIQGWDIGCAGMKVGGKRKLVIPSKLAYGSEGSPPTIPSNATLTFTVEIKAINGKS